MDFAKHAVLVTGASQGIGAAIARRLGEAGATVAVHYNSNAEGANDVVDHIVAAGGSAFSVRADLSQRGAGAEIVSHTIDRAGRLDVVVNNAGSMIARRPAAEVDDDYFDEVINVNLRSAVATTVAAMPHLALVGGNVVNVVSVSARTGGGNGAALYGAAKAALATYTRGLAREVGALGVRANAVSPGVIETPFHDRFSTPASLDAMRPTVPLGRYGEPSEIAEVVAFLASNPRSSYLTGQVVEVNGGMYSP